MTTPTAPTSIREARAQNLAEHGTVEAAREYADDMGFVFCEDCYAVSHVVPYYANDGHQCLEDGTADRFKLPGD